MNTIRVLIADDEEIARKRLRRLIACMDGFSVIDECVDGSDVLERMRQRDIDILVVDIQMPGLSGLEVTGLLSASKVPVVLCTAHPEHAIDAFAQGAVDYVLKPVDATRLQKALVRARERISQVDVRPSGNGSAPTATRLPIVTTQGIELLDPNAVIYAELDGALVSIHTVDRTFLSDQPLNDLASRLPREHFERVHRRAVLNFTHVVRLEPIETGGFIAHMSTGARVEVSRQAARDLRRRLGVR